MDHARKPVLCYVTDRRSLAGASGQAAGSVSRLGHLISRAIAAGVDWIQIREKDLPAAALLELSLDAVESAAGRTRVIVNDRLDVALAAGAGGVHLGEKSLPAESVVRWVRAQGESGQALESGQSAPRDFFVGVSCHSLEAALAAERAGVDYVVFGPVFETPSKAALGPPQGLGRLADVCTRVRIPVLAIGGLTLDNSGSCLSAGAAGIAAIRLFQDAGDVSEPIRRLRTSESS